MEVSVARPALAATLLRLGRPRIQAAVLVSLVPTLVLEGLPAPGIVVALVLGTLLTGAACDAFNAAWEGERDALMTRTAGRPVATGELPAATAFLVSAASGVAGTILLFAAAGILGALVGILSIVIYTALYTTWLKARSPLAAIVGGAAGCVAPLLADACDGSLSRAGLIPFLVLFTWTPPHVWAIACRRSDEYARAGFRCLPVVAGLPRARLWGLAWLALLVPVSLLPFAGSSSPATAIALVLDGALLLSFVRAAARPSPERDRRAFVASVRWLAAWLALLLVHGLFHGASA